jgi:hypothetical protein
MRKPAHLLIFSRLLAHGGNLRKSLRLAAVFRFLALVSHLPFGNFNFSRCSVQSLHGIPVAQAESLSDNSRWLSGSDTTRSPSQNLPSTQGKHSVASTTLSNRIPVHLGVLATWRDLPLPVESRTEPHVPSTTPDEVIRDRISVTHAGNTRRSAYRLQQKGSQYHLPPCGW